MIDDDEDVEEEQIAHFLAVAAPASWMVVVHALELYSSVSQSA